MPQIVLILYTYVFFLIYMKGMNNRNATFCIFVYLFK